MKRIDYRPVIMRAIVALLLVTIAYTTTTPIWARVQSDTADAGAVYIYPTPALRERTTVEPATVEPLAVEPLAVAPATVEPPTVEPATVEPIVMVEYVDRPVYIEVPVQVEPPVPPAEPQAPVTDMLAIQKAAAEAYKQLPMGEPIGEPQTMEQMNAPAVSPYCRHVPAGQPCSRPSTGR